MSGLRGGAFAGLAALIVACLAIIGTSAAANSPHRLKSKFTKHDRVLLAKKRTQGARRVSVIVVTPRYRTAPVAKKLRQLGAKVVYRHNRLGYIRALVPTRNADKASRLAGIQAINMDETLPLPDPRPEGQVDPTPQPPPGADTPRVNPYMPTRDTGAAQFVQNHPSWDGRGVTVGILDTGVDLDHPSLNTTSTGQAKIADWVTYTHPSQDGDPTWRFFTGALTTISGGSFTAFGRTYTGFPIDGQYRVARMREDLLGAGSEYGIGCGADLDRDGGCGDFFAMVWRPSDNTVWVDADGDASFADDDVDGMKDFRITRDVHRFGHDNPATAVRESVPFTVLPLTDPVDGLFWVNIGIVSGAHGSHVAGITAGNRLFGGEMSGAAPGAKIVSVRVCLFVSGCTSHALIEGMIYAAEHEDVDVINMSIGGLPALNDGNNTRAVLYNRLIDDNNVQMFISAGNNGPGVNTIGDPAVASKVMAVGSYIHKETWQRNYGSDANFVDNMHPFSSRGPAEDGGFKPQIIAPGSAISSVPTWQGGQPVAGTYTLPPGYGMFNGTSMASPQAAGAAALLISAAKQEAARHPNKPRGTMFWRPAQIRGAMNSTARFIDGYNAADQGNGLLDVEAAWRELEKGIETTDITSRVRVNTILSDFLAEPGFGRGIYDREGVTLGQSYVRTYTFKRTSGPNRPMNFHLRWKGNDGTFSVAQNNLSLRLNVPTTLNVTVNPQSPGVHSAILMLENSSTRSIDYETMNTIIVPVDLTGANGFSTTFSGQSGRNYAQHFFVRVPAGNPVLKVDLTGPDGNPGTGQTRFLRFHPWGLGVESNSSLSCYTPAPPGGSCAGDPLSRTFADATAGVWEITVESRRTSDAAWAPFSVTASLFGVSVSPNPDVIENAQVGVPVARTYTLTNNFGAFTGRATGSGLGSARRGVFTIANHELQHYTTTIPAGTTSFRATIGGPSDPAADLDLFVYRCSDPTCATRTLVGQNADGDSEESVTINNPTAATYQVDVDGFAVPAGTTTYNYVDVFQNPGLGSVSITDADAPRPQGASWTVNGSVTAMQVPEAGRVLLGSVNVVTAAGVQVGRGDVVINHVTP